MRHSGRGAPRCLRPASRESTRTFRAKDCDKDRRAAPARTVHLRPTLRRQQAATICCARISSGDSGIINRSRSPWRIARTKAAHSSRSSRVVAKKRPLGIAPRQWPERPTRCNATAIARGELICTPDRPCRYRFPTRAKPSRPALAPGRLSAFSRRRAAACATGCRGAPRHCLLRCALPDDGPRAPPGAGCSRKPASNGAARPSHEAVVNLVPHFV